MLSSLLAITGSDAHVSMGTTLLFGSLLVLMILGLALEEKLHAKKSVIVGVFAALTLLLGAAFELLPFGPVLVGDEVKHEIHATPKLFSTPAPPWPAFMIPSPAPVMTIQPVSHIFRANSEAAR